MRAVALAVDVGLAIAAVVAPGPHHALALAAAKDDFLAAAVAALDAVAGEDTVDAHIAVGSPNSAAGLCFAPAAAGSAAAHAYSMRLIVASSRLV